MASRRTIALIIMFGFGAVVALPARADSAGEACTALVNVRSALYSMLNAKGNADRAALEAQGADSSKKLESVLAAMSGNDAKRAGEFKAVWEQFKATRENEIIPALQKGNVQDAKRFGDG